MVISIPKWISLAGIEGVDGRSPSIVGIPSPFAGYIYPYFLMDGLVVDPGSHTVFPSFGITVKSKTMTWLGIIMNPTFELSREVIPGVSIILLLKNEVIPGRYCASMIRIAGKGYMTLNKGCTKYYHSQYP